VKEVAMRGMKVLAPLLLVAVMLIVAGVAMWSLPVALIVAGVLLAAWSYGVVDLDAGAPVARLSVVEDEAA
jgi:hypothetical protein